MRLIAVALLSAGLAAAGPFPCEPSPEIRAAVARILAPPSEPVLGWELLRDRRQALDRLLAAHADDPYVRRYAVTVRFNPEAERQKALASLAAALERNPNDAFTHYLYARMSAGHESPRAIEHYTRALALAPDLAWAHIGLAQIYESPNFRDQQKLRTHLLAALKTCPASTEAYPFLTRLNDPALAATYALPLRRIVEGRRDAAIGDLYRSLWTLEFQAAPVADHPSLRTRVAADLRRLDTLAETPDQFAAATAAGFRLLGNEEEARKRQPPKPSPRGPLKRQPDEARLLSQRIYELRERGGVTPEEATPVGLAMEPLLDRDMDPYARFEYRLALAALYAEAGLRLDQATQQVELALIEMKQAQVSRTTDLDNRRPPDDTVNDRRAAQVTLVKIALRRHQFDRARTLVTELGATAQDAAYWEARAEIAAAEGHNVDALFAFRKAVNDTDAQWLRPRLLHRVKPLWLANGGTEAGWQSWQEKPATKPGQGPVPADAGWLPRSIPVPEFRVADHRGRTWTRADLKGKLTFINVWATWCEPCRRELPEVEKLYQILKDRTDVVFLTLSLDENPALVTRFLEAAHYSFPALIGPALYADIAKESGIPRSWILNRDAVIVKEQTAFTGPAFWRKETLAEIEKSK